MLYTTEPLNRQRPCAKVDREKAIQIDRLFAVEPSPFQPIQEIGAPPRRLLQPAHWECVCTDERAIDDMQFDAGCVWMLYLCNDVGAVLECRPGLTNSLVSAVESVEEARERERRNIIRLGTNRRRFVLGSRSDDVFQGELANRFLDRWEQGATYCVSLEVELLIGSYGDLPDYAGFLDFMSRDVSASRDRTGVLPPNDWMTKRMLDRYSTLGSYFAIDAPACLPINVIGEGHRRVVNAVLEIVSPSSFGGEREFKARLFSRQRLEISAGDTLTRTACWNAGRGEKRQSVVIATVI
jgi:hypothetical protein